MCFPSVSAGGPIINAEKELYALSRARFPFSSPYFYLDCFVSLSFIFRSSNFLCLRVHIYSRMDLSTDFDPDRLQHDRFQSFLREKTLGSGATFSDLGPGQTCREGAGI